MFCRNNPLPAFAASVVTGAAIAALVPLDSPDTARTYAAPTDEHRDSSDDAGRDAPTGDRGRRRPECEYERHRVSALRKRVDVLRGIHAAQQRRATAGAVTKPWPADVPRLWQPEVFEQEVMAAVDAVGAPTPTFDCTEPPCLARFPPRTTDDDFDRILARLRDVYGVDKEWAFKGFYEDTAADGVPEQSALFVFSYLLPGQTLDEDRPRLLERGGEYVRDVEGAAAPAGGAP